MCTHNEDDNNIWAVIRELTSIRFCFQGGSCLCPSFPKKVWKLRVTWWWSCTAPNGCSMTKHNNPTPVPSTKNSINLLTLYPCKAIFPCKSQNLFCPFEDVALRFGLPRSNEDNDRCSYPVSKAELGAFSWWVSLSAASAVTQLCSALILTYQLSGNLDLMQGQQTQSDKPSPPV